MQTLRSMLFFVLLVLSVAVWAPIVCLVAFLPYPRRFAMAVGWGRFAIWLFAKLCSVRMAVEGVEHIPEGPCVVLIKHSSPWETIAELVVLPQHTWVLKREILFFPFLGWAVASLRCIAINRSARSTAVRQVLRKGRERLASGINVHVFPEGTRMPAGTTRRYGLSGALLAVKAGVPVLPVAHNAADHWPSGKVVKHPGTITMVIGPPIDTANRTAEEVTVLAKDWIDKTMVRLSPAHHPAATSAPQATVGAGEQPS